MEEIEIEEPIGKFILDNLPIEKRVVTANGLYIHYSDVCQLLKKYHEAKVKKLSKGAVIKSVCSHKLPDAPCTLVKCNVCGDFMDVKDQPVL